MFLIDVRDVHHPGVRIQTPCMMQRPCGIFNLSKQCSQPQDTLFASRTSVEVGGQLSITHNMFWRLASGKGWRYKVLAMVLRTLLTFFQIRQ